MFVERVAFEAVPDYARVDADVVRTVRTRLLEGAGAIGSTLDAGFRAMERTQPAIASFIAHDLASIDDPDAQGIAFFLAVVVVSSFEEAFGHRLGCVELADLRQALERLIADGELRGASGPGRFYSEDALAVGQPALVRLLRAEFDAALEIAPRAKGDLGPALDVVYETLLVTTLALTHAVAPS